MLITPHEVDTPAVPFYNQESEAENHNQGPPEEDGGAEIPARPLSVELALNLSWFSAVFLQFFQKVTHFPIMSRTS